MKNRVILAAGLCVVLMNSVAVNADPKVSNSVSLSDILGDSAITTDAHIGFIESYAVMGESAQGLKIRGEIEAKRDSATKEIQEGSKKLEKSKSDYIAKSTTMSDSAREKEEKKLIKMDRDLKNLLAEKEEEIKLDMQLATEKLAHDLDESIVELASNENLDIILDKSTGRAVYVSDKYDFTAKAITKVNEKYELKLAQAQQAEKATTVVADNKKAPVAASKVSA